MSKFIPYLHIKFEPRDLWIGVFWDTYHSEHVGGLHLLDVYVCIVPMLPIRLTWTLRGGK